VSRKKKQKDPRARQATTPVPQRISRENDAPAARPLAAGIGLAAILLLAIGLRCAWLDSTVGGFHSHNEAHYTLIAKNYFHGSPLLPTSEGGHLFLETPPFYSYLLNAVFRLTGVSILAGRLLSVASSLALVVATFVFSRRLFGSSVGLTAALIVAVSPVAVLTGRNIQTDSTLLLFVVAALFFHWRAEEGGSRADRLRSGLFAGLALFTKLFSVIAVAALFVWELATKRTLAWLKDSARWRAAGIALLLPGVFYGYHALRGFGYLQREVAGGAAVATTFPRTGAGWGGIGAEAWWAFSPLIALALAAGIVAAVLVPSRATLFALFLACGFSLFYLFAHKHSYYLLTILPFGAALAGRLISRFPSRGLRIACAAAIAVSGSFWSLVDVTSMKSGFVEFEQFGKAAAELPGTEHLVLINREMGESHLPVIEFYDPKARFTVIEDAPAEEDGRLRLPQENIFLLKFVPPQSQAPPAGWLFTRTRYSLCLFGRTILEAHPNPHFFRQGRYFVEKTGGFFDFGRREYRVYPALALLPVPADLALYRTPAGLEARPAR
jgi:hypothetical protein